MNTAQFAIRWITEARAELKTVIGDALFQSLIAARKRGELVVTEVRERSKAEIEMMLASDPRQNPEHVRLETVPVGRLAPLEWIEFEFLRHLRDDLMRPLDEFEEEDHAKMKTAQLKTTVKRFDSWERTLEEAEQATKTPIRDERPQAVACGGLPDSSPSWECQEG